MSFAINLDKPKPLTNATYARLALEHIWLDYINNYLTFSGYAERNSLSEEQAAILLNLAHSVHHSNHIES